MDWKSLVQYVVLIIAIIGTNLTMLKFLFGSRIDDLRELLKETRDDVKRLETKMLNIEREQEKYREFMRKHAVFSTEIQTRRQ